MDGAASQCDYRLVTTRIADRLERYSAAARRPSVAAFAALAAAAALLAGPAQALAGPGSARVIGSVRQVAGLNGCYTDDGSSASGGPASCRRIRGGGDSTTLVVSPDGRFAYLDGYGSGGGNPAEAVPVLSVFSRDARTGVLHQLAGKAGCLSDSGGSPAGLHTCTSVRDLSTGDATSIAISADGRFVYVASQYEPSQGHEVGGIAVFSRSLKTGILRELAGKAGCVTANGSSNKGPGTCARAREVDDVSNVHITPDQKYLYASNYDGQPYSGIAIFRRNAETGALTQLAGKEGCITAGGVTAQSKVTQICRAMPNIGSPWDVATPGNTFAYIPDQSDNLVQAFWRDAKGGLKPLTGTGACVSDTGSSPLGPNTCVAGRGLYDVERAVLSKNGAHLYTNGYTAPSPIAVLDRNRTTGLLSQRSGAAACYSVDGTTGDSALSCRTDAALGGGYAGALSPSGQRLYYAEYGSGGFSGGLVVFRVVRDSGRFAELGGKLGCVTSDGKDAAGPGMCQRGRAVGGAYQVFVYGSDVYLASSSENGVALFHASG